MKRQYTDEHAESGVAGELPEIETWPNQYRTGYAIEIVMPEFTSVCPKTGLPDHGTLTLRYVPDRLCLELKSLKMYTLAYRNLGIFQENVVNKMLKDVVRAAKPISAELIGDFAPRGGISTKISSSYKGRTSVGDDELSAVIQAVRDRARAATPNGSIGIEGIPAPDFLPLVHARDAAEAKVAAIGTVNPRPPGAKNSIAQRFKKLIARALDWHVREQVEFNRASMACIQASLEIMADMSRALAAVAAHSVARERQLREDFGPPIQEALDVRRHWIDWRQGFEDRRNASEIHMLRTISELQSAFQHRVTMMDQSFRESVQAQHMDFAQALTHNTTDVQQRLWADLVKMRGEIEALIYTELRLLRLKGPQPAMAHPGNTPATGGMPEAPAINVDWMRFADAFRGREEDIRARQQSHAKRFTGTEGEILDLGCGRGEFLEAARDAGLKARGVDLSEECVALCCGKGLAAEQANLFTHLQDTPDRSLGGIFCAQVVEHLQPAQVPALIQLMSAKVRQGGLAIVETPNPECLAIFATHFYIDPTHTRPVPPVLLRFYLEEAGFGRIEIEKLAPAADSIPALKDLPAGVVDALFGGLDYAIFARKL